MYCCISTLSTDRMRPPFPSRRLLRMSTSNGQIDCCMKIFDGVKDLKFRVYLVLCRTRMTRGGPCQPFVSLFYLCHLSFIIFYHFPQLSSFLGPARLVPGTLKNILYYVPAFDISWPVTKIRHFFQLSVLSSTTSKAAGVGQVHFKTRRSTINQSVFGILFHDTCKPRARICSASFMMVMIMILCHQHQF